MKSIEDFSCTKQGQRLEETKCHSEMEIKVIPFYSCCCHRDQGRGKRGKKRFKRLNSSWNL